MTVEMMDFSVEDLARIQRKARFGITYGSFIEQMMPGINPNQVEFYAYNDDDEDPVRYIYYDGNYIQQITDEMLGTQPESVGLRLSICSKIMYKLDDIMKPDGFIWMFTYGSSGDLQAVNAIFPPGYSQTRDLYVINDMIPRNHWSFKIHTDNPPPIFLE